MPWLRSTHLGGTTILSLAKSWREDPLSLAKRLCLVGPLLQEKVLMRRSFSATCLTVAYCIHKILMLDLNWSEHTLLPTELGPPHTGVDAGLLTISWAIFPNQEDIDELEGWSRQA